MGGGICQVIFMCNPTTEVVLRCVVVGVVTTRLSSIESQPKKVVVVVVILVAVVDPETEAQGCLTWGGWGDHTP